MLRFTLPFLASFLVACVLVLGLGACQEKVTSQGILHEQISGQRAYDHVAAVVAFGPRPVGSDALEKTRQYIEAELGASGWQVQRQSFPKKTTRGEIEFTNLRARFGDKAWQRRVTGLLCSHYDTKSYEGLEFVGANDGGSSTGLLLELARVLALQPSLASRIELVFFDGEEALGTNITASDGLYGSRHYARELLTLPTKHRPRWGLLLDMVGDASLNVRAAVRIPTQALRELSDSKGKGDYLVDIADVEKQLQIMARGLLASAGTLGYRDEIGIGSDYIIDDHIPLNIIAGVPTMDIIDFDYPPWHTPGDTLDKISADSLDKVGKTVLHLIENHLP